MNGKQIIIVMNKLLDFANKRILVTGAASGIGRATALLLSQQGADLILLDLNKEGLESLRPYIKNTDVLMPVDLSNSSAMVSEVENAIKTTGPIDGMALVAGMLNASLLKYVKEDLWEKIEKVNLYSTIELAKLFTKKGVRPAGVGGNYYNLFLLRTGRYSCKCLLFCNKGRTYRCNQSFGC